MPNRAQRRRALQCATTPRLDNKTHKLTRQTCVVWVPQCRGYVSFLSNDTLRSVDHPALACHLSEDDAEALARAVRQRLGLHAAIRPYYASHGE